MNTDELDSALFWAERRVLEIQAKLHRWAVDDPHRRFGDLNCRGWVALQTIHLQDHARQIANIKAMAGYPLTRSEATAS